MAAQRARGGSPPIDDVDQANDAGVAAFARGDLDAATARWRRVCVIHPRHPEATHNLAMLAWQRGSITDDDVIRELKAVRRAHLLDGEDTARALELAAHPERLHVDGQGRELRALLPASTGFELRPRCVRTWSVTAAEIPPAVAFGRDGSTLLHADGRDVVVVDLATGARRRLHGHEAPVRDLAVSPDGATAVSVDDGRAVVWDLGSLTPLRRLSHPVTTFYDDGLTAAAMAEADRLFLACRGAVEEWDTGRQTHVYRIPELGRPRLALSPDGDRLVVADINDMLYVLDTRNRREAWHAGHSTPYHQGIPECRELEVSLPSTYDGPPVGGGGCCVAIPPPGTHAWCGNSDRKVLVWNLATGALETTLQAPFAVSLIAAGRRAGEDVVLSWGGLWAAGKQSLIVVWSAVERRELCTLSVAPTRCLDRTLAVSPDGRVLATGDSGARVRLWHLLATDKPLFSPERARPRPDAGRHAEERAGSAARRIAQASPLRRLRGLWPAEPPFKGARGAWAVALTTRHAVWIEGSQHTGTAISACGLDGSRSKVLSRDKTAAHALAALPDGRVVCAGSAGLQIVDPTGRVQRRSIPRAGLSALCVAADRTGTRAVTGGHDGLGLLWDLEQERCVAELRGHNTWVTAAAFAGSLAITGSGSAGGELAIRLWDLSGVGPATARERRLEAVRVLEGHQRPVGGLSVSADDQHLLSASDDGSLRLWRLPSGEEATRLQHPSSGRFVAAALSGCARFAAALDDGGVLRVYDLRSAACCVEVAAHRGKGQALSWSRDARFILTAGGDDGGLAAAVVLWELDWES
jgi:WD40 repeat protein